MKTKKLLLSLFALSLTVVSCSDDDSAIPAPSGAYSDGFFVLNQGNFGRGNASVSFISNGFELEDNIFSAVNPGMILGDTAQDMGLVGSLAYIVLNNSHKIEIVDRYTFKHIATIEDGLDNPRYIAFANGKAFVTNWGDPAVTTDDFVAVIDLGSNTVIAEKAVAEGPERIIAEGGKLYVAHKGGYGYNNKISVMNAGTNAVETTITVGYVPEGLKAVNGKLYVLNGGVPSWAVTIPESSGSLMVINLANNTVATTLQFGGTTAHPANLQIEGNAIYYTLGAEIHKMALTASTLPSTPLFTVAEPGAYGVDGFAVKGDHIYVGNAGNFTAGGKVFVHSLTGGLQHTFTAGIGPVGFYFN